MRSSGEVDRVIDKYCHAIAEPSRLAGCPPLIRELARASQGKRHVFTDAAGEQRERMPIRVIAFSYFLRAGHWAPGATLALLDRAGPSAGRAGPQPFAGKD